MLLIAVPARHDTRGGEKVVEVECSKKAIKLPTSTSTMQTGLVPRSRSGVSGTWGRYGTLSVAISILPMQAPIASGRL
jgi:hypothetical protein